MKSTVVKTETKKNEIDWSVRTLVQHKDGQIILTSGKHTLTGFEGTTIVQSKGCLYNVGHYSSDWVKETFTLCELPVTITFEN